MREILEDFFQAEPFDPVEAARRHMRPKLRRRFYRNVDIAEGEGGLEVRLDHQRVNTPRRRLLAAPTRALAEAIAGEWNAAARLIDPSKMPLTRLANSIIDGVADAPGAVAAEVA